MASRIVHFGYEECIRLAVLRNVGYRVESSGTSIFSLARLLMKEASDAIAISEDDKECNCEAIRISRSLSPAPIILFEGIHRKSELPVVDLAIRPLTPTAKWLGEIERVIQHSREICAESEGIRAATPDLRENSKAQKPESTSARQNPA